MSQRTFRIHGITDPDAWDCEIAEYMCCIEEYDGKAISRITASGDGWYDIHFEDGHEIPGVAGFHIQPEPEPGNSWDPSPAEAGIELAAYICG